MIPPAAHDDDASRIALFSAAMVARFGRRALDIAEMQADLSHDSVSASWRAIAHHIAVLETIDSAPDDSAHD